MLLSSLPSLKTVWLVAASTLAGIMNAMAGGGSFLSFPAMLGMGVPPVQANATNTVALWPGQLTSLATLWQDVRKDLIAPVAISCIVGGIVGAEVLLHTRQRTFLHMIPWLILAGTLIFGMSGRLSKWARKQAVHSGHQHRISKIWLGIALFPVCFYIGYFGAGGGLLTMTILALFGLEEMHALNALKVVSQATANFCAIGTFVLRGAIEWRYCLVSMVFAALGGWVGARFARRMSGDVLRAVVVATGCVVATYFFWKQAHGG